MLKLETRPQASKLWSFGSPLLALAITVLIGIALFAALGKDPVKGLQVFFWEPVKSPYALGELMVKATPLLVIALGLAVCFRSNVWNIGAEGQFVIGAVVASGVALLAGKDTSRWIVLVILLGGVLGGMAWASLTALLRDRFNANEILVSLMLVYVADMVLSYLVYGPWKDPGGYNFPQTKTFEAVTQIPRLMSGSRVSVGLLVALAGAALLWVFLFRTRAGFGRPPRATPVFPRAGRCGRRCSPRAGRPAWPARWRWRGRSASSRPTCRRAMALPPSSWPSSAGCIRRAWCSRPC
jgi:general nucleoside transport system permease protein